MPSNAKRVNLDAGYFAARVSFECEEDDFREWTKQRGWTLNRYQGNESLNHTMLRVEFPDFPKNIENGYVFSNSSHRGGYDLFYDIDRRRAWLLYAHN